MADPNRNILVLFAHPGQRYSKVNVELAQVAANIRDVTLVDLYAEYPRFKINVEREQERLLEHDVIVFQFPLFWYSTPALLKEWQDLVLEYGFAYGEGGDKIAGKFLAPVITAGGPEDYYQTGGRNNFPLRDLLAPLEQTANLCGMRFLPPYALFSSLKAANTNRMRDHVEGYERYLRALRDDRLDLEAAAGLRQMSVSTLPIREEVQP